MAIRKRSCASLVVLLSLTVVSFAVHQVTPEECPFWKDIAASDSFQEYIVAASRLAHLDIGLPPEFSVDEYFALTQLLRKAPISVRIISGTSGLRQEIYYKTVNQDQHALVLIFCKETTWKIPSLFLKNPYVMNLCVIGDYVWRLDQNYDNLSDVRRDDFLAIYNLFDFVFLVYEKHILSYENFTFRCLNCSETSQTFSSINILQNRSIEGIALKMYCQHPYFCDKAKFQALDSIVKQKNASFYVTNITTMDDYSRHILKIYMDPSSLIYFSILYNRNLFFPFLSTAFPYDSLDVLYYSRGREPVLKEILLFLPLDSFVWLAILVSFLFLFTTGYIITKLMNTSQANVHILALPFAALLLQQGAAAPRGSETYLLLRFILGTCALSATVLSTGYKWALASLFSNVPLSGESMTPFSMPRGAFRVCFLSKVLQLSSGSKKCFESPGKIKIGKNGNDVFIIYGSGYEESDDFKDQLIDRNYIEYVWFQVITGPEMHTNSLYRNAISNLFSRAFEAGIFKRFVSLQNHKRFGTREFKMHAGLTKEKPMSMSDLRPCFVLWGCGIIISCSIFIIQIIVQTTQGCTLPWNRCRVQQL